MDLQEDYPNSHSPLPAPKRLLSNNNTPSTMLMAFAVSMLIVAAMAMLFGQRIGYNRGISYAAKQAKIAADGQEISASNVKALKLKSDMLQSQLATAQQERDISLANLAKLREDTESLRVTNLQLEQGQTFLTKALAKKGGIPLQVIGAKIVPLPESAYEYRFDVGMVDTGDQQRILTPKLTLLDEVNMVEVPLEPSSYKINGVARIRGRFIMPKDFVPKQVKLELSAGGQLAEHIYDWQLGQPVDDMPYSLEEVPEADARPVTDPDNASLTVSTEPNNVKNNAKNDANPEAKSETKNRNPIEKPKSVADNATDNPRETKSKDKAKADSTSDATP